MRRFPGIRPLLALLIGPLAAAAPHEAHEEVAEAATAGEDAELERGRAAAFLECEGLGEVSVFWRELRRALAEGGVLGSEALRLAYTKYSEWEQLVDEIDSTGKFNGEIVLQLPGDVEENGTPVETRVHDRLDLLQAMKRAHYQALFGTPHPWGPHDLAGFLACPLGFVIVHYVINVVHKVRSRLPAEDRRVNWESFNSAYTLILGAPSMMFDHLESSRWGITSFDMAVNMNEEEGSFVPSYAEYCTSRPVPAPRLRAWWEDAPVLLGTPPTWPTRDSGYAEKVRVALVGEHGPTNLDHLSTVSAALRSTLAACSRSGSAALALPIEAAHFVTYLWALKGTVEGRTMSGSIRITWEAFWGEPLTASQGRAAATSPRWTVSGAVQALRAYVSHEPFLRAAWVTVCCEPLWLCVLLHAAMGGGRLLVRASMCLLHAFSHVFGTDELPEFWPLVRAWGTHVRARGTLSAAARITAEMLDFQAGIRAPYVPALSLHVANAAGYAPHSAAVLLFRASMPSAPAFRRILGLLAEEVPNAPRIEETKEGVSMSFAEIAQFRAVAFLPHVPHALRLADVYALGCPVLVPALPLLHKFIWPYAGPFCGLSDPDFTRSIDAGAENRSCPPFSPFEFQSGIFQPWTFHDDRRYWVQYTEWELRPHLLRFSSARELLQMAALSELDGRVISARMRASHAAMVQEALGYWRSAIAVTFAG